MGWNVDVEFKRSPIHGIGTFALHPIKAGTKVWQFDSTMLVYDLPMLRALPPRELELALRGGYPHLPSGKFVCYDDGMHLVNHANAARATIGITEWTPLEEDHCAALRDLEAGEELTENYNFWSIFSLRTDHWLREVYRDYCAEHYRFLRSISREIVPA